MIVFHLTLRWALMLCAMSEWRKGLEMIPSSTRSHESCARGAPAALQHHLNRVPAVRGPMRLGPKWGVAACHCRLLPWVALPRVHKAIKFWEGSLIKWLLSFDVAWHAFLSFCSWGGAVLLLWSNWFWILCKHVNVWRTSDVSDIFVNV